MEKTGSKETTALFIILILSRVCLGGINGFINGAGITSVANVLIGAAPALGVCLIAGGVFDKESFGNVFKKAYGKAFGTGMLCLFFIATILSASSVVRNYTVSVGKYVLPDTPDTIISAVFSFCIFAVSYFGIESITRYSLATLFVFLALFGIILFSSHTEAHTGNLYPLRLAVGNAAEMTYIFSDIIYMFLIVRCINRNGQKAPFYALGAGGIITVVLVAFYVLCVPYPVSEMSPYPLYRLASLANTTVVFQRLDGIVYIIWMFLGFISSGALGYFAACVFDECFGLYDKKATAPLIAVMVFLLSKSVLTGKTSLYMSLFTFVLFPVSVIIYKVRSKR